MKKSIVSQTDNTFALNFFSELLKEFVPIAFFGTLLGLVRDGRPIVGDDDVDFYVERRFFSKVKERLIQEGFAISEEWPNTSDCFLQIQQIVRGHQLRVDFYFYDLDIANQTVIEKWNFMGKPESLDSHLRIPVPLLYPIVEKEFACGYFYVPSYPSLVCEFLYGINWRTPQKKGIDYLTQTIGGRPVRFLIDGSSYKLQA